jgi:hypothetical protein
MKRIRLIPTILGLLILIIGVASGVLLINKSSNIFSQADSGSTPNQLKITNIAESSFSVSWVTNQPTTGFIKYGDNNNLIFVGKDDRDQLSGKSGNFSTHHVTIRDLKPALTYYFKIVSGGNIYDNNGAVFQTNTAPVSQNPALENDVAYGTVIDQNGAPVEGAIIYLTLPDAVTQSTLTKNSGSWVIPLNLTRSSDLSTYGNYDRETTIEEILVQGLPGTTATVITITKKDSPIPAITLGGNFDFRNTPSELTGNQELTPPGSQFSSPDNQGFSPEDTGSISIINPSAGENINTQKPEFIGNGPVGETINIVINSPTPLKDQVTVDTNGNWNWSPSANLSPGEHSITISLPNGKSVTRRFTVLAADSSDLPFLTASPSATLTPTIVLPSTSPTPLSFPSLVLTPTITNSPTPTIIVQSPQSGNLTPTLSIFIMGGVLVFIGLSGKLLYKET